jgi:hypothetical protein
MPSLLVFNIVYGLKIQSVMLVLSTGLLTLVPLTLSLVSYPSPPPPPFPVWKSILYARIQCVRGGVWGHRRGGGQGQIKHLPKVPLQVSFLDDDIWHCFLSV